MTRFDNLAYSLVPKKKKSVKRTEADNSPLPRRLQMMRAPSAFPQTALLHLDCRKYRESFQRSCARLVLTPGNTELPDSYIFSTVKDNLLYESKQREFDLSVWARL